MKKLTKIYYLFFISLYSCSLGETSLVLLPEQNIYQFYNDKRIDWVQESSLFETTINNLVPTLVSRPIIPDMDNLLFHNLHRAAIYYNPDFYPDTAKLKDFDYQFFVAIDNITNDQLSYTNLALTNVDFYFYQILTPVVKITNNASLYLNKINDDEWDVSLNYANFNFLKRFRRAN